MHRKRRESLTIRLPHQPEQLRTGQENSPRSFLNNLFSIFTVDRQSNLLGGLFF
jgi:hypothetical protein